MSLITEQVRKAIVTTRIPRCDAVTIILSFCLEDMQEYPLIHNECNIYSFMIPRYAVTLFDCATHPVITVFFCFIGSSIILYRLSNSK